MLVLKLKTALSFKLLTHIYEKQNKHWFDNLNNKPCMVLNMVKMNLLLQGSLLK